MATAKKTTTKKPTTKVAAKKSVKKSPKVKKSNSARVALQQSFRRAPEQESFFTFRITQQSLYWLILALVILALGLWVIKLHIEVQDILDRIEQNEVAASSFVIPTKKQ